MGDLPERTPLFRMSLVNRGAILTPEHAQLKDTKIEPEDVIHVIVSTKITPDLPQNSAKIVRGIQRRLKEIEDENYSGYGPSSLDALEAFGSISNFLLHEIEGAKIDYSLLRTLNNTAAVRYMDMESKA